MPFYNCGHCVGNSCIFYECEENGLKKCEDGLVCVNHNCVHPCKTFQSCREGNCIEDPEINGVAQYHCECEENTERIYKCCNDYSYFSSPDSCYNLIGFTEIEESTESSFKCYYSIGCYYKEPCNDSDFCRKYISYENTFIDGKLNHFGLCDKNNQCQLRCENDIDCIGEDEYCSKEDKMCYKKENYSPCDSTSYFLSVTQECVEYCKDDSDCPEPVNKCNVKLGFPSVCMLACTEHEDCLNYKWSSGNLCDKNYGYCSETIRCESDANCYEPLTKCDDTVKQCRVACSTNDDCINNEYSNGRTICNSKGFCIYK